MTAHSCMAIENTENLLEGKSYTIKYVKIKDTPEEYKAPNMADFEIIINDNSAIILMPSKISHEHDSDLRYETLLDITLRQPKSIVNTTARIINVNPPKMLENGNQCQIVILDDSSYTMQFCLFGDYVYRYTIGDKLDIQGAKVMIHDTTYISMSRKTDIYNCIERSARDCELSDLCCETGNDDSDLYNCRVNYDVLKPFQNGNCYSSQCKERHKTLANCTKSVDEENKRKMVSKSKMTPKHKLHDKPTSSGGKRKRPVFYE